MKDTDVMLVDAFDQLKYKMAFLTEIGLMVPSIETMNDVDSDAFVGFHCFARETQDEIDKFRDRLTKYVKRMEA